MIFVLLTKHLGGEFSHSLTELLCPFISLSSSFFWTRPPPQPPAQQRFITRRTLALHSNNRMTRGGGTEVNNSWHRR